MFAVVTVAVCILSALITPVGYKYIYTKILKRGGADKLDPYEAGQVESRGKTAQGSFVVIALAGISSGVLLHCFLGCYGVIPFVLTAFVIPNLWVYLFYPFLGLCKRFGQFISMLANFGERLATGKPKKGDSIS